MEINGCKLKGITCDSRKVKSGYAFVAVTGDKLDGNDYIDRAIEKGAIIVFTEKDIINKSVPIIKVVDARKKLAELLNEFYNYPSEKLKLIGVTGTNGKTTTSTIIHRIFVDAGYKTGLIGTLGIKMGDKHLPSFLTTPDPETLFLVLDKMVKNNIEVVIMEVSSHGLKYSRTYGLQYEVAIHTNIERDHLDIHKTFEDYLNTKKILFDSLGQNKIAIINIDDENGIKLLEGNDRVITITYGLNNKATITASSLEIKGTTKFNLCMQRGITTIYGHEVEPSEFVIKLNLVGKHNVFNTLAAISTALYFGIGVNDASLSLEKFMGVNRRLEKIYDKDFLIIDDFSHNPASYEAVFEAMQNIDYKDIIIVNAVRGNRGIEINEENANVMANWIKILGVKKTILSLSNDIVGEKDKVSSDEVLVYRRVFNKDSINYDVINTLKGSLINALSSVEKGDIILLLGAQGMDKGKEVLNELLNLKKEEVI